MYESLILPTMTILCFLLVATPVKMFLQIRTSTKEVFAFVTRCLQAFASMLQSIVQIKTFRVVKTLAAQLARKWVPEGMFSQIGK